MMVNTAKGKEVRLYFLECERIAKDKLVQAVTQEVSAVEQVRQFSEVLDIVFSQVNIQKELLAGKKINYAQKVMPAIAQDLEEQRQLLIQATAKDQEALTVTQIGQLMTPPVSARKVNELLITKGYQIKNALKKSQRDMTYTATPLGQEHSTIVMATGKTKDDSYQQLRWYDSIVRLL